MLDQLRQLSTKTGLPVSELIRRAIEDYLKWKMWHILSVTRFLSSVALNRTSALMELGQNLTFGKLCAKPAKSRLRWKHQQKWHITWIAIPFNWWIAHSIGKLASTNITGSCSKSTKSSENWKEQQQTWLAKVGSGTSSWRISDVTATLPFQQCNRFCSKGSYS